MEPLPPIFSLGDQVVYARHYRVPIAFDISTQRPILPAEAVPGVGDRYQCFGCRQFVHVVTRHKQADRPRETWWFSHARDEADKCRGEGIDHVMASAAVTWLLTRHLTGATTLICEHRCGRCRTTVPYEIPRIGVTPSINHQYTGTARVSDVALVDSGGVPVWAIEIRQSHIVDGDKAKEIPCAWAEVAAKDLLDILEDPKRRYQDRVVLQVLQGRPADPPPQSSGVWHCAECCAKPPLPEIPGEPDLRNHRHGSFKLHEKARLRAIKRLAEHLRSTNGYGAVQIILPERCDRHDAPLVLMLDRHLRAVHVTTPAPSPQRFSWDVTFSTWPEHEPEYRMKPMAILVVGSRSHPTVENGSYAPPGSMPFLMIDMATISDVQARARMAVNISLPRWCPVCRRDEAAQKLALQNSHHRIRSYIEASRSLLDEYETITERAVGYLASNPDWEALLYAEIKRYRRNSFLTLMAAAAALQPMDHAWFNDHWHDCQEGDAGIPTEDMMPLNDAGASIREHYGPDQVQAELRARIEGQRSEESDRATRIDVFDRAAVACAKTRRELIDLSQQRNVSELAKAPTLIKTFMAQIEQVLHAADRLGPFINDIGRGSMPLCDPVTGQYGDPGEVIGGRDNLESHLRPKKFIDEVTEKIAATTRQLDSQSHLAKARTATEQARMARAAIACTGCTSLADFEQRLDEVAAQIRDFTKTARDHLLAITEMPSPLFDRASEIAVVDRLEAEATRHSLFHAQPTVLRQIEKIERDRLAHEQSRTRLNDAIQAFTALCNHLAGLRPNEEWDVIGAPLPAAALTAMHKVSVEERPHWARDAIQVMSAGMLTTTSEAKRQRLLEIRKFLPLQG